MKRQQLWASFAAIGMLTVAPPSDGAPATQTPGAGVASPFGGVALAPERLPHGAAVVVASPAATGAARVLARRAYREAVLRPDLEEATVATLIGAAPACTRSAPVAPSTTPTGTEPAAGAPAPGEPEAAQSAARCDEQRSELHEVLDAVAASCTSGCNGSPVARSLLTSLGRDLGVAWIVLVTAPSSPPDAPRTASVQLLHVATGRFEPMVLGARAVPNLDPAMWDDVVPILRSLVAAAPRTEPEPSASHAGSAHRAKPNGARRDSTAAGAKPPAREMAAGPGEAADDDVQVLSSPWFWGGLGVLVAAGVTVFAISQSSLGEPNTVRLEGRVAP